MGSRIARVHAIPVAIDRSRARFAPGWTHVRSGRVPAPAPGGYRAGVAASAAKSANASQTVQEVPVNTRTIALVALVIAVIVLILLLM
jgi:hypothetical protein